MKTALRIVSGRLATLCAVALMAGLLVGCQTSGKAATVAGSTRCPLCQNQTRRAPFKGITYTKHVCPMCKTVRDTGTSDEAAAMKEVHVCDHCKATVDACPICAKK